MPRDHDGASWWLARATTLSPIVLGLLFVIVAGVVIVRGVIPSRAAYDQKYYHEPAIREFARNLPSVDVWDYLSATTPGYHLTLGAISRLTGDSVALLQALSACFTLVLLLALARAVARRMGDRFRDPVRPPHTDVLVFLSTVVCLPLITSMYVFQSGVYLLPDNAGWVCVLGVLLLSLRPRWTTRTAIFAGLVMIVLVLMRQIHVWSAAMVLTAAWLSVSPDGVVAGTTRVAAPSLRAQLFSSLRPRVRAAIIAAGAMLPAMVLLLLFVRYWEGLVPPRFREQLQGPTLGGALASPAIALVLATIGGFSAFFVAWWIVPLVRLVRTRPLLAAGILLVTLVALLAPNTTYDIEAGRRTGLWNLTPHFPVVGGRTSVLILGLGLVGACAITGLLSGQRQWRDRWIVGAGLIALTLALSMSAQLWQRYIEAFILMLIALLAAGTRRDEASAGSSVGSSGGEESVLGSLHRSLLWLGPLALAASTAMVTINDLNKNGSRVSDVPPPLKDVMGHQGVQPPALLPRPVKPPGRTFWGW